MKVQNLYRILAAVILVAIGIQRAVAMHRPPSMVRYHENVRAVAGLIPSNIAGWVGEDVAVPVQATTVLRPNVMISRRYLNIENGTTAGVLLVHSSDAHAMAGHYPLRCYPARGWDVLEARPRDWQVGDLLLTGMEYTFTLSDDRVGGQGTRQMVVANCLFRPGCPVLRDMDSMVKSVIGAGGQASGAGQVQVYFDARVPVEERDGAIRSLLGGYKDVIQTILRGADK